MDFFRFGREAGQLARDAIVKTRPDAYDEIGRVHREVGLECAVHARHADELRIGAGKGAQSHQGQGARRAGVFDQPGKGLAGGFAGIDQSAAAIENRALRLRDEFGCLFETRLRRRRRFGDRRHRAGVYVGARRCGLQVFRKIQQHRSRTAGGGEVKCVAHQRFDLA